MPLRDHFRSPVKDKHRWDAVHGGWPMEIVRSLFDLLPPGYQAEPKIHLGSPVEVDISTHRDLQFENHPEPADSSSTATLVSLTPTLTVETELTEPDEYEVRIYDTERGQQLVAAIEIVSPSNVDRPETRDQFIQKVTTLMQQDVSVSIIDLVTTSRANLYAELLASLGRSDPKLTAIPPRIYCVTLRLREQLKGGPLLDAWFYPLQLGEKLPSIPIWLNPDDHILLPLETSYEETCRLLRIA
jgi:hypothetical protein